MLHERFGAGAVRTETRKRLFPEHRHYGIYVGEPKNAHYQKRAEANAGTNRLSFGTRREPHRRDDLSPCGNGKILSGVHLGEPRTQRGGKGQVGRGARAG